MGIFVDWKKQFDTGETQDIAMTFVDGSGAKAFTGTFPRPVYSAPLGDLLQRYIRHCQGSWRKRWSAVWRGDERRMRAVLNQISLEWVE